MEKHDLPHNWHNLLKKEEELLLITGSFLLLVVYVYIGFQVDQQNTKEVLGMQMHPQYYYENMNHRFTYPH